ncbi:MAG TPA: flagellar motor stator protein MotA [Acidobacteriaceae bacterium]|jgi:chemotaxis protein MotA|nr:flagellar motor stator protein MotA [Acidobacteriaceae bacterium]
MFAIIGILVVFGAVAAGYLMEHGHLAVLVQPAELLIIGGAGIGTLLIANPLRILKKVAGGAAAIFGSTKFGKARYLETLRMMYELLQKARRGGMLTIENDVEKPEESEILKKYPGFLSDHHVRDFVCDTLRMVITGGVDAFDMDQMMDLDMEVQHQGAEEPVAALATMADSLPGLGIVAAVLGVVITMGALGGPAEEIGHKVAAALVGTFLGILLCYGLVGPVSQNMAKAIAEEHAYLYMLRVLMLAFIRGQPPVVVVEVARRAIPAHVRPSFAEVEEACRNGASAAAPAGNEAVA